MSSAALSFVRSSFILHRYFLYTILFHQLIVDTPSFLTSEYLPFRYTVPLREFFSCLILLCAAVNIVTVHYTGVSRS